MSKGKSGAENVERLRRYLDDVDALPARGSQPNVTAITVAAGIDERPVQIADEGRAVVERALDWPGKRFCWPARRTPAWLACAATALLALL
jgi:hypothetical protein